MEDLQKDNEVISLKKNRNLHEQVQIGNSSCRWHHLS